MSKFPNPKKNLNGFLCDGGPPCKRHRYAPRCSSDPMVFLRVNTFFWPDNAQDALEMVGPFVASASRELVRVT